MAGLNFANPNMNGYFDFSNTEMSHFARISTLINEQGADRIRQYVLDNLPR